MDRTSNSGTDFVDDNGNKILVNNNVIMLKLQSETHTRRIGEILPSRTLRMVRAREKHLLRKAQAYGFNHYVLANRTRFDFVLLCEREHHYKIPVDYILESGSFLWFKQTGFERQLFLTLEQLKQFIIKPSL